MKACKYNKLVTNTAMLYILSFAKIFFPLLTIPYLTRVLSVECYGVVAYVKSVMGYMQIIIDFGFLLSAVKDIVQVENDRKRISYIVGDTIASKILLTFASFVVLLVLTGTIPMLRANFLFTLLSFLVPALSCFLLDFFFRGIEQMHMVTITYVFMKTVSTVLTVAVIKDDSQILLIPIFDIISSFLSVVISFVFVYKAGYSIRFSGIKKVVSMIRGSFLYFANSAASTAFGALNTVIIGAYLNDAAQIAFWSVCMQLVGAVQTLYTPLSNGIYPHMIKTKNMAFIRKIMFLFMPLVIIGSLICFIFSPTLLTIVSGEEYAGAATVFRMLLPVLIISFPVAIYGWPVLGAIKKVKEINISTIAGAAVQIVGLFALIPMGCFTIYNVAILRNFSEFVMCVIRLFYVSKYKYLLSDEADHGLEKNV